MLTSLMAPIWSVPRSVLGLDDDTARLLGLLADQWMAKYPRNLERQEYLDGKNRLKDLGIALPPSLKDQLEIVMGWPEKAVFELANRIILDGVKGEDGSDDPFGLAGLLRANRFDIEFPSAVASSLTQSVSFGAVTPGGPGEPDAILAFHSAQWATGLWDRRRRALKAGLEINDTDDLGQPTMLTILLPDSWVICRNAGAGWYVDEVITHSLGRVPMEPLPYAPTTERPFGRSRIDRRVMSLTDRAMRNGARLEVHSELFATLKLILLGVSEDTFTDDDGKQVPLWSWAMSRMNYLTRDEEGEVPSVETITAQSPQPHIEVARQLAADFSGHTGVPLGSLGIATDNPESQGAKQEAREDIVAAAENQHVVYGAGLSRLFEAMVMTRDGLSAPPAGMDRLSFDWRPPARPTLAALADAGAKQVAAIPGLAETEVGMELIGLTPEQIRRVKAERTRMQAADRLKALMGEAEPVAEGVPDDDAAAG